MAATETGQSGQLSTNANASALALETMNSSFDSAGENGRDNGSCAGFFIGTGQAMSSGAALASQRFGAHHRIAKPGTHRQNRRGIHGAALNLRPSQTESQKNERKGNVDYLHGHARFANQQGGNPDRYVQHTGEQQPCENRCVSTQYKQSQPERRHAKDRECRKGDQHQDLVGGRIQQTAKPRGQSKALGKITVCGVAQPGESENAKGGPIGASYQEKRKRGRRSQPQRREGVRKVSRKPV